MGSSHKGPTEVIGVSGRTGSGKSTTTRLLAEEGFVPVSTREVLSEVLDERGETVTRAALQRLGAEVHSTLGQRWLFDLVTARIGDFGRFVIDGLRFPEDHAYLAERYDDSFLHIHVEAPTELRRPRFMERGGTSEEFEIAERNVTESGATEMRQLANVVVVNDQSVSHLKRSITQLVSETVGD
jgi:dephospho-CoA kinase